MGIFEELGAGLCRWKWGDVGRMGDRVAKKRRVRGERRGGEG